MDIVGDGNIVEFPLRGEWAAIRTPAHRVPSHGTGEFGQRYAFDFVRLKWKPIIIYSSKNVLHHLFGRLSVKDCFSWSQPVYSPFDGEVVSVGEGWPDILEINQFKEIINTLIRVNTAKINSSDIRLFAGNYVVVRSERFSALLAHLRNGSVKVREGQQVRTGELLAEVGNSGNTVSPHLHFQLMKGDDPVTAVGLPCRFRSYERYQNNTWEIVAGGIPGKLERIRYQVE